MPCSGTQSASGVSPAAAATRWRTSATQLSQIVGVRARIDGVVVTVDGVVGQDAHIATVRSERDRVVLRDAAECREWPGRDAAARP